MDLEGYCRRGLEKETPEKEILRELTSLIIKIKFSGNLNEAKKAEALADAVLHEVKKTGKEIKNKFVKDLLTSPKAGVKMGEMGVGSRGEGDFFVHRKIGKLASLGAKAIILPDAQDDAGVVETDDGSIVVVTVDGTHSRLSDYPFIAGFHVARAALRDIYVNGGKPVALLDDLHLADDGDVGKLFDFVSGISAVGELTGVPLVAGSTLRVGGDMVIGERMVSCVGAVGVAGGKKQITARKNVKIGDKILMTSGAGGGTIATTAIYSGNFDAVLETLNVDFIKAGRAIYNSGMLNKIHAMLDVTNGGIRGDANEVVSKLNEENKDNENDDLNIQNDTELRDFLDKLEKNKKNNIKKEEDEKKFFHGLEKTYCAKNLGEVKEILRSIILNIAPDAKNVDKLLKDAVKEYMSKVPDESFEFNYCVCINYVSNALGVDVVDSFLEKAKAYCDKKEYENAIKCCKDLLGLNVCDDCFRLLGDIYYTLEDYDSAATYYEIQHKLEEGTTASVESLDSWINLSKIYRLKGNKEKVLFCLKNAVHVYCSDLVWEMGLWDLNGCIEVDKTKRIIEVYKCAVENISDSSNLYNLAMSYLDIDEPEKALPIYKKYFEAEIKNNDDNSNLWEELGCIYHEIGEYKKAIKCFKKATINHYEESKEELEKRIKEGVYCSAPGCISLTLWYHMGNAYYALKDYKNAVKYYEKASVAFPEVKEKINEISSIIRNNIGIVFYEPKIKNLVNKKVFELLKNLDIDYLGVSIDSLMIFAPPENCGEIIEVVRNSGVEIDVVGEVVSGGKAVLVDENNNERELKPLFRESGYTKIKKVVGEKTPEEFKGMKKNIERAYEEAIEKRKKILEYIKNKNKK